MGIRHLISQAGWNRCNLLSCLGGVHSLMRTSHQPGWLDLVLSYLGPKWRLEAYPI